MAERILELRPEGLTAYLGNFDDYLIKKQELLEIATENALQQSKNNSTSTATPEESVANSYEESKQAKRDERNRQRRTEQLEKEIADWEERIGELEQQLTLPEVYQDYEQVQKHQAEIADLQQSLEHAYEEWETLAVES